MRETCSAGSAREDAWLAGQFRVAIPPDREH